MKLYKPFDYDKQTFVLTPGHYFGRSRLIKRVGLSQCQGDRPKPLEFTTSIHEFEDTYCGLRNQITLVETMILNLALIVT